MPLAGVPDQWIANFVRSPQFIAIMREQWGYQWPVEEVDELPRIPFEGQRVEFVADAEKGITWELVYRPDGNETYPWKVLAAKPLTAVVNANDTISSSTFVSSPGTAGPSIELPLSGDYLSAYSAKLDTANTDGVAIFGCPEATGFTANDDDAISSQLIDATAPRTLSTYSRSDVPLDGISGTVEMVWRRHLANCTVNRRKLSVLPTRVGRP